MVRWVFFDVGNVLLDEDPLTYRNFRRHVEAVQRVRPDRTFHDLPWPSREARARVTAGDPRWPLRDGRKGRYLDEKECAAVWEATAREIRDSYAALSVATAGASVHRRP